jgi:4-hydroxy-tetrahydrodipicolinate reductase
MKIALIGFGAMGRLVAERAKDRGHNAEPIDYSRTSPTRAEALSERLKGFDVAIDFTEASSVLVNVEACMLAGVPLVEGTTGWSTEFEVIKGLVESRQGALVYGANFSIGVNLFYRLVEKASLLFSAVPDYDAFLYEAHHKRKRDAPSGTALVLKQIVEERFGHEIDVSSTRAGFIPGTHEVGFDSPADQITLRHTARSREGFAAGAVFAAEWIVNRKGVYDFAEVIDEYITGVRDDG